MNICSEVRACRWQASHGAMGGDLLRRKQAGGGARRYILMRPSKMSRHIIQSPRKL
ncbi:hypothetical protein CTYAZ2_18920 [Comamonas testosteroni]|nr:hypothetical protein CTYAZ2_18920 [Comamonas testosteroni]